MRISAAILILFGVTVAIALWLVPNTPVDSDPIFGAGETYATWNSADKSANIALSGGDLTATHTVTTGYVGVRSTIGKSTGKWYWEVTIGAKGGSDAVYPSAMLSTAAFTGPYQTGYWGYLSQGYSECANVETGGKATFGVGDVIGIALDADADTVQFFKNNTSQFTCTSVAGTVYAGLLMYDNNDAMTANFGATALTYTPPSGFNPGLYDAAPAATGFDTTYFEALD